MDDNNNLTYRLGEKVYGNSKLKNSHKLLFIYLINNNLVNFYEFKNLSIKTLSTKLNISNKVITKTLKVFTKQKLLSNKNGVYRLII